jgi:hypothetical protein
MLSQDEIDAYRDGYADTRAGQDSGRARAGASVWSWWAVLLGGMVDWVRLCVGLVTRWARP